MKKQAERWRETLDEAFSIKHKVTPKTEKDTPHIHRQFELIYPLSDNLVCWLDDQLIRMPAHSFFLLSNADLHQISRWDNSNDSAPAPCDRYVLYFAPEYLGEALRSEIDLLGCFYAMREPSMHVVTLDSEDDAYAQLLLHRLTDRARRGDAKHGDRAAQRYEFVCLLLLICQTFRTMHPMQGSDEDSRLVYEIIDYIHEHYAEAIRAQDLGREFLLGKTRLYDLFNRVLGVSPHSLLIQFRMNRATDLLASGMSVAQTGQLVGYDNLSHFSQIFKQRIGMSPKHYQKLIHQLQDDPMSPHD